MLTAEIAGSVALVGVAIGTSVVAYKSYSAYKKNEAIVYNSDKINVPGDPWRMAQLYSDSIKTGYEIMEVHEIRF